MFLRIPLIDPDRFLQRTLPMVRWLISPLGAVLWLVTMGAALKVAADNWGALRDQTAAVLAPGNLVLLYGGLLLLKLLHELGHAYACRRFGGEVHQMGVMLMYLSPLPYVDATSSWAFRSKAERILVASAGMIVELFVAALAVFVWATTGEGTVHSLAYNMIFVASLTTLLFNANPLLKYDGYYIVSDLLEVPNLQLRSTQMLRHCCEKYLFGRGESQAPTARAGEGIFLGGYGVSSWIYRVVVFTGIALFVSDHYLLLGVVMALACVYSFTVKPLWQLTRYLASSPNPHRVRRRALLVTCGAAAALFALLAWWPMPNSFRAPGIVRAEQSSDIFTVTSGLVQEIGATSGQRVAKGHALLRLATRELELELAAARAELARVKAEEQRALAESAAELAPIRSRRLLVEKQLQRLEEHQRTSVVTAPHHGMWVAPETNERAGRWLSRGEHVGQVIEDSAFRFSAVISQEEAAELFTGKVLRSEVRVAGQAASALEVTSTRVIPMPHEMLPSAALGWVGGGDVATSQRDPSGARAAEPFFEVRASLQSRPEVRLLHGRSGKIRVELRPQPLLVQWSRKLRQLLQKKYQL